ncbi:sulfur carrier protein ThiS [Ralstonia solanacearum]|uniref:Sulfur carrier protein ThiS n=2 Tax=Ralstonia solanacearum TaxID=305 RepID=A0AAW5ZMR7_RALSL|nr:sulfur carrier protein ThiS [Ralstonia solanacearum]AYB52820.2 sulfur carrier protein ThiS [Ralstonia solanacearum]MBT1536745.1 sulfur carrier protein ThiS [Ralstonia solanacearum]MDB0510660.1 sulfur carrier protein ThiS [Ralstonia solanacearum]MDB0515646.1 sulfur carrier protein ThiS [Ralstonia solanacearum]MDB0527677.1 sulfur carrier protein ThiS [Ralstonia solanacearum]
MTLNVTLNDLSLVLPTGSTLADAIGAAAPQLQIAPPFAASVNGEFVPKARHAQHALRSGDRIALVQPVVGG